MVIYNNKSNTISRLWGEKIAPVPCIQITQNWGVHFRKNITNKLGSVQRRPSIVSGLETALWSQKWLKELGLLGLEKRERRIDPRTVFASVETCHRTREEMCRCKKERVQTSLSLGFLMESVLLGVFPEVELLHHMLVLCLIF